MTTIHTRIAGIPCQVQLNHLEPITPAYRHGHPDNWEPESGGEMDFTVLDRRGRPAPWLDNKLTDDGVHAIKQALLKASNHQRE